jgi:hypothetical protein
MELIPIVREGWQERHPNIPGDLCNVYPDAVEYIDWGPKGRIIERVKNFADITFEDIVAAGLKSHPWAETILAKDRSIDDAYTY